MSCPVCQLPLAAVGDDGSSSSNPNPCVCPFCSASFSRADAARRHAKSCSERSGRPLHQGKRGRKTKSCHECARLKLHCRTRGTASCERCLSKNVECSRTRCCTDPSHRHQVQNKPAHSKSIPLSFLLNYTDEKRDFVTERVVGQEPDAHLVGPTSVAIPPSPRHEQNDEIFNFIDPSILLPWDPQQSTLHLPGSYSDNPEEGDLLGAFLSLPSQRDILSTRLTLLEQDVASHATSNTSIPPSCFNSAHFGRFFTVSNMHIFASIFCRKRHYQFPIIHWPTFNLENASLPLLMMVGLTGATYSYRAGHGPEYITQARKLYHIADSYIFHHLKTFMSNLSSSSDNSTMDKSKAIELLQASLLMYALDILLVGDTTMQHTAVTERMSSIISALRRLNLVSCRHEHEPSWDLFVQRETAIRLVSWTYCGDCLHTLSLNLPPSFSLLEMTGHLPCETELWDADSEEVFLERLKCTTTRQESASNFYSLKELMTRFLGDWRIYDDWERIPLFHLHVMLCAFQPLIFNHHVGLTLPSHADQLLRRLAAWRRLWGRAFQDMSPEAQRQLGITRNAPDIELLSRRIIQVAAADPKQAQSSSPYLRRIPTASGGAAREIHEFIRDFIVKEKGDKG